MLMEDVLITLRVIEGMRRKQGKDDHISMKRALISTNVDAAMSNKQLRGKVNHTEEVKEFLREVVSHQQRLQSASEAPTNPLEAQSAPPKDKGEAPAEVVIPVAMKPFIEKEINFQVFLDLLTEKVDMQRVSIPFRNFKEIEFSRHGLPEFILHIFSFLAVKPVP